jgi:DNA-binding transcriptional LysR family regulator
MNTNEELFLLLAEELNFSRAAKKAFISQQCLSAHIKKLEDKYGTKLFLRKPSVKLTPSGLMVRDTLLSIKQTETGLKERLSELEKGRSGIIRAGINSTRASIIIPEIFSGFHTVYPDVKLEFTTDETSRLTEALEKGLLDCVLGVNGVYSQNLISEELSKENLYFMVSDSFLSKHADIKKAVSDGASISLSLLDGCEIISDTEISTTWQLINRLASFNNTHFKPVLSMENYDAAEKICRFSPLGFFCPEIVLKKILKNNTAYDESNRLVPVSVSGLDRVINFSLVYFKNREFPRYMLDFFNLVHQVTERMIQY